MAAVNYAEQYSTALAQAFPYVLYFGALYNTENNGRYQWLNSKTIQIPTITTTGRVDADRDSIGTFKRNVDNSWKPLKLENERKWSTLVHPKDIDQTNMVLSIQNITKVFNETQKFPEMDAYLISKVYTDWAGMSMTADQTVLSKENILEVFDDLMVKMDEERVPPSGRILYVTATTKKLLKQAEQIQRQFLVQDSNSQINRNVSRLDEVELVTVPSSLMKTEYEFTTGWTPGGSAKQINMFLVHPISVITPVSYSYSGIEAPSPHSEGKYLYYEESHEDAFVLEPYKNAIQFNITAGG